MSNTVEPPIASPVPGPKPVRSKWIVAMAGTALLVGAAGVWFQYSQAPEGKAQTRGPQPPAAQKPTASSDAYARVNNVPITYEMLARECVERHGTAVLENMINQLIIQQECQRQSLSVSAAEVEQEVARVAKQFNLPLDAWYQMLESERGLNRQQYHDDVIWPMLALKKLAGSEVQVSEQDMQIGFERDYGPRMKGRMILFDGNSRQVGEIWEKCKAAPDDFGRIATEFSSDSHTRPLGGVIPPIRRHGGDPRVEAAAFALQPGEISPVVQVGEKQYVILKCEGFTEPVVQDIKVVWNDLYAQLVEEKTQMAVAKVFKEIQEKATVHNFLTRTTSGPPVTPASGQRTNSTAIVPAGTINR